MYNRSVRALFLSVSLFFISASWVPSSSFAASWLIEAEMKCGKAKNDQPGYRDIYKGVISSQSVVMNFQFNRRDGTTGVKNLYGYIAKDKLIIKGEGATLQNKDRWKLMFSSVGVNDMSDALRAGVSGKESPGSKWERECKIKLTQIGSVNNYTRALRQEKPREKALADVKEQLREKSAKVIELKARISAEQETINGLLAQIDAEKEKLAQKTDEETANKAAVTAVAAQVDALKTSNSELEAAKTALESELTQLTATKADLEKKLESEAGKTQLLQAEVNRLNQEVAKDSGQINNDDLLKFARTITNLEDELATTSLELDQLRAENEQSVEQVKSLEASLNASNKALKAAQTVSTDVTACSEAPRQEDANASVVAYLESKIKQLEVQVDSCSGVEPAPSIQSDSTTVIQSTNVEANSQQNLPSVDEQMPVPSQRFLIDLVASTKASYSDSDTDAKKKLKWIKASKLLCSSAEFDIGGEKRNWVGFVDDVYMTDQGDVRLELSIDDEKNEVSGKIKLETLIALGIDEEVIDYEEGDRIQFSGSFVPGNMKENECISAGLMSNPELLDEEFRFEYSKVKKLDGPKCSNFSSCFGYIPNSSDQGMKTNSPTNVSTQKAEVKVVSNPLTGPTQDAINRYPFLAGSDDDRMVRLIGFSMEPSSTGGPMEQSKEMFVMMCTYDAINPNQLSKQNYKELYSSWTHLKTERSQLMEVFKLMGLDKEFEYCKYS